MSAGDELVDVIDDSGCMVRVVTRRELRAGRLPHRCTYIFMFNSQGDIFLHLRTATKDVYPSHWDVAVGGVLAAGESFADGARRELREELGVEAPLEELFPFHYADARTVVHAMVYKAVHDGPFRLQEEEIVRGKFVPLAEFKDRVTRVPFCPDGLQAFAEYERRIKDGHRS